MVESKTPLDKGIRRRERKALLVGLLFVSPWLVGFLLFQLYPLLISAWYSLTDYSFFTAPSYIGFDNYRNLFHDEKFYLALNNTLFLTLISLIPSLVFALLIALLLNNRVRGLGVYRTIYFLPTIVPVVASSLLWLWLLNSQYGIVNQGLELFGLPGKNWLVDPDWTKPSLAFMGLWGTGTMTVMFLAALQDVPKVYYEAASIDGARSLSRFRHITLPAISPMILYLVITSLIGFFQYFTQPLIFATASSITGEIGGPENSMLFYSTYLYQQAFKFLNMGYASALAWVLVAIVMFFTLIIFRTSARWVYYGGEK